MAVDFDRIKNEVEEDLKWEMINCHEVCLKIPSLKSKYCAWLYEVEVSVKSKEMVLNQIYKELHEAYISGNMTNVLIDRRDVDFYIKGNDRYIAALADYELEKNNAKYIEGVLRAIDSMSFSINAAIKWAIFQAGGP